MNFKRLIAFFFSIICLLAVSICIMHLCLKYSCELFYSMIGIVLYVALVFVFKITLTYRIAYYSGCIELNLKPDLRQCLCDMIGILSLDYSMADINKDYIPKESRAYYIITSNKYNLLITIIFVVISFLFVYFLKHISWLIIITTGFMLSRFLSRTMEINLAFFIDIFKDNKQSSITKERRIKLACVSLLEEVFLFTFIYLILSKETQLDCSTIIKCIFNGLQSLSVDSANYQTCCRCIKCIQICSMYQGICSLILITLSIATYISSSKNHTNYFELLGIKNHTETDYEYKNIEFYITNTSKTYLIKDYYLRYTIDGRIEYLISKYDIKQREVIINRVLFQENSMDFSKYIEEIKENDYKEYKDQKCHINEYKQIDNFILENGALKTAVGLRKVFIPSSLDYYPCSFAKLFTLRYIWVGHEIDFYKKHYLPRWCKYTTWPPICK